MKKIISKAFADKIVRWTSLCSYGILFVQTVYIFLLYFSLPPLLPIFNQMPWGQERLGSRVEILLPIMIACAFVILNSYLLTRLYEKVPLVSRILSVTTLLITILSAIFIFQISQLIL